MLYTIDKKVYDVIINSIISENVVSKALIKALHLLIEKLPHPYKIRWIKKGTEAKVTEICKIPFSIMKYYQDEVAFDVIDMDAFRVLHGCPWQFNVNAIHKG